MAIARFVTEDVQYSKQYQALFGELPDFSDRTRFPENAGPELKSEWYAAWEEMQEEDQILVNRTFANVGKTIAAYERLLVPAHSRFDAYAENLLDGNDDEKIFGIMKMLEEKLANKIEVPTYVSTRTKNLPDKTVFTRTNS